MNTPNPSDTQNDLSRVLEKITEIASASTKGDYIYIYRGESKCHGKVCSGLYREYEADIEAEYFDIAIVQEEILLQTIKAFHLPLCYRHRRPTVRYWAKRGDSEFPQIFIHPILQSTLTKYTVLK